MAYEWVEDPNNSMTSTNTVYEIGYGEPIVSGQPYTTSYVEVPMPDPGYREEDLYQLLKNIYGDAGLEIREFRKTVTETMQTVYTLTDTSSS